MSEDTGSGDGRSYRHIHVEDAHDAPSLTDHKYELDEAVDAREFGFNVYVAIEGQPVPWGRHHHPEHEETFYVLEGALAVEMGPQGRTETLHVGPDEAVFVPPGTWNRAVATADGTRVIAVGAPKAGDRAVIREPCGAEADRLVAGVR